MATKPIAGLHHVTAIASDPAVPCHTTCLQTLVVPAFSFSARLGRRRFTVPSKASQAAA